MSNTIDLALMAGASYVSNRPSELNRLSIPQGWSKISAPDSYVRVPESGFEAVSFIKGSEIVISFAGTNFTDINDWTQANVPLAFGLLATQLKQAADYYLQIKTDNPAATITLAKNGVGVNFH